MELDKPTYDSNVEPMESHINVGYGSDVSIAELSQLVKDVVGYEGKVCFDPSRPDGAPRKLMDTSRLNRLGWSAKTELRNGLFEAYINYMNCS
jgi:GDP-L-fucose synthase